MDINNNYLVNLVTLSPMKLSASRLFVVFLEGIELELLFEPNFLVRSGGKRPVNLLLFIFFSDILTPNSDKSELKSPAPFSDSFL